MPTTRLHRSGFSLLELLIVVGIIGVLCGLLIPSALRVRDGAKIALCAANERQLYQATIAFVNEKDGRLPIPSIIGDVPTGNGPLVCWAMDRVQVANFEVGTLLPYIAPTSEARRLSMWCPSDTLEVSRVGGGNSGANERNFSYSFNGNIKFEAPGGGYNAVLFRRVLKPSEKIIMYEEFGPNDGINYGPTDSDDWISGRHGGVSSTVSMASAVASDSAWRRIGKSNQLFFDGHVEMVTTERYLSQWGKDSFGPLTK